MDNSHLSPTVQKLRSLPNHKWNPIWPKGTVQPLTPKIADRFLSLLCTSSVSLLELLKANPELPPYWQLHSWRTNRSWFADAWSNARKQQAHFIAQKILDLAESATPQTAHEVRVKFDIYKWICAKFHPDAYADKPQSAPVQTVNLGFNLSPQRLHEIRANLDSTRSSLKQSRLLRTNNRKLDPAIRTNASASMRLSLAQSEDDTANGETKTPSNGSA